MDTDHLWALVLAGGDATRLQALTRLIAGAPIPKQYCRILIVMLSLHRWAFGVGHGSHRGVVTGRGCDPLVRGLRADLPAPPALLRGITHARHRRFQARP